MYVNKGDFRILTTVGNADTQLDVNKGDTILQVDNNSDESVIPDDKERGSVYIRKGAINLASAGRLYCRRSFYCPNDSRRYHFGRNHEQHYQQRRYKHH